MWSVGIQATQCWGDTPLYIAVDETQTLTLLNFSNCLVNLQQESHKEPRGAHIKI